MPTPREAYTNTVEQRPYSGARLQPGNFGAAGETLGNAAAGFGQDLNRVAVVLDKVQETKALTKAKLADNNTIVQLTELATEFEGLEGLDPSEKRQEYEGRINEIKNTQTKDLKDPRALRMFEEAFEQRRAAVMGRMVSHEIKQTGIAQKAAATSLRDTNIDLAADAASRGDEEGFNTAVKDAVLQMQAISPGRAQEEYDREAKKIISTAHAKAVETISDPLKKEEWRTKNSEWILPDHENQLIKSNQPALEEARTDIHEGDFLLRFQKGELADAPEPAPEAPAADAPKPDASKPMNVVKGNEYSPVGTLGRRGQGPGEHAARGSFNKGRDFAAPAGTAIRPPVGGKVIGKGYDDKNGHFVRVQYADGKEGIWLHMKQASPLNTGDPVEPSTVIGLVGSTGKSSGPHVHYSVKDRPGGNFLDVDSVTYSAQPGAATAGRLPIPTGEDLDTETMLRAVRTYALANNLTPAEERRLASRVRLRVNDERGIRQEQQTRVDRSVLDQMVNLGEGFTRMDQIPGIANASPEIRARAMANIEQNTKPKPVEAYGETFMRLFELSNSTNPRDIAEFKRESILSYPDLTNGEKVMLRNRQASMDRDDTKIPEVNFTFGRARGIINMVAGRGIDVGYDPKEPEKKKDKTERQRAAMLEDAVAQRVQKFVYDNKRQPNDADLVQIVKEETVGLVLRNPKGERTVTPRYLGRQDAGPNQTIFIPAEEKVRLKQRFPHLSEAELSEIYARTRTR